MQKHNSFSPKAGLAPRKQDVFSNTAVYQYKVYTIRKESSCSFHHAEMDQIKTQKSGTDKLGMDIFSQVEPVFRS